MRLPSGFDDGSLCRRSAHLPQDCGAHSDTFTIIEGALADALEISFDGVSVSIDRLSQSHVVAQLGCECLRRTVGGVQTRHGE